MSVTGGSNGHSVGPDWYKFPSWIYVPTIIPGIVLVEMLYLCPHHVPYAMMGPLGDFSQYLLTDQPVILSAIFYGMNIVHLLEGLYAVKIARDLQLSTSATFKWWLQTTIMGFSSLFLLTGKRKQLRSGKIK